MLQGDITKNIICHDQDNSHTAEKLDSRFESKELALSFSKPVNWKTNTFQYEKWYKSTVNKTEGSLWTLPTDATKLLILKWNYSDKPPSEKTIKVILKQVENEEDFLNEQILKIQNIKIENNNHLMSDVVTYTGTFDLSATYKGQSESEPFTFKLYCWNKDGRTFYLITSMINRTSFWEMPTDLTPLPEIRNRFYKKLFDQIKEKIK